MAMLRSDKRLPCLENIEASKVPRNALEALNIASVVNILRQAEGICKDVVHKIVLAQQLIRRFGGLARRVCDVLAIEKEDVFIETWRDVDGGGRGTELCRLPARQYRNHSHGMRGS
jgi:hypothetical protein